MRVIAWCCAEKFSLKKSCFYLYIRRIINSCEQGKAVGGQPLVWNYYYGNDPRRQINIGKAVEYWDLCIQSNLILRIIFRKRFNKLMYINEMPYMTHIEYQMPSGAFFVLKKDVYNEIEGFDENTFLYGEETILAYKLKQKEYHLLFCPEYCVKHLQGATTGYDRYSWDGKRLQYLKQSRNIYAKEYLKCNKFQIWILELLRNQNRKKKFNARKVSIWYFLFCPLPDCFLCCCCYVVFCGIFSCNSMGYSNNDWSI